MFAVQAILDRRCSDERKPGSLYLDVNVVSFERGSALYTAEALAPDDVLASGVPMEPAG
jgi:hypothetical protein